MSKKLKVSIVGPKNDESLHVKIRSSTIKKEFGKLLKKARIKKGLKRTELARFLKLKKKKKLTQTATDTEKYNWQRIANWENGIHFIRDLSLIPEIYYLTGIYIPALLDEAIKNILARR